MPRPHFVYILKCADPSFYVGLTHDPALRESQHNAGRGGAFTASRLPVRLVFSELHTSLESARKREKQLKHWSVAKKTALINGDAVALRAAARRRVFRRKK
jgi:putative endonuclease